MPYNPETGLFEPFPLPGELPYYQQPARPSQSATPPLTPEESDSLLTKLTGSALSGLGWVGGSLSKAFGGRAIKGVLGGRPHELASLIPFSDTLGITNPEDEVHGRDLLDQWGVTDKREGGGLDWSDIPGLAVDLALDPATYIGGIGTTRALTKAGQAAAKTAKGLLPTAAERIAGGQSGLVNLALPFSERLGLPSLTLGTGPGAEQFASKLGDFSGAIGKTAPARALKGLFGKDYQNTFSDPMQRAALRSSQTIKQGLPDTKNIPIKIGRELAASGEFGQGINELPPYATDVLRAGLEGTLQAMPGSATEQSINQIRSLTDLMQQGDLTLGGEYGRLENYAPRHMKKLGTPTKGFRSAGSPFDATFGEMQGRDPLLEGIIGGTSGTNAMIGDPAFAATSPMSMLDRAAKLRQEYMALPPEFAENVMLPLEKAAQVKAGHVPASEFFGRDILADNKGLPDIAKQIYDKSLATAQKLSGFDPQYAEKGLSFFGNPLLGEEGDLARRLGSSVRFSAKTESIYDAIKESVVPAGTANAVPLQDVVKSLQSLGLKNEGAIKQQLFTRLGVQNPQDLMNTFIRGDVAKDLPRYIQGFAAPESLKPVLEAWDSFTQLFKTGVTNLPFVGKYIRDLEQGWLQRFFHNGYDPRFSGPKSWLQPAMDAATIRKGQVLKDANTIPGLTHLTPEAATKELADLASIHGVYGAARHGEGADIFAGSAPQASKITKFPGAPKEGLGEGIVKSLKEGTWNPFDSAGVGGRTESKFKLTQASQKTMEYVDDMSRLPTFIAKMRQGFSPEAAAREVNLAHYDYGNLSQFEKSVMRRVMPFYSWSRQNIPAVVEDILTRPGGKQAQMIKATAGARHDQGFVPEYVSEGLAVPLGSEKEGTQRFLSHFDTPYEDAFGDLAFGPKGPLRTFQNYLGELNPAIKAPLELAGGKQFRSGRDLQELYGSTGNQLLDQLIYNSPVSRYITTARTLADERKGIGAKALNILTPLKVTDVDLDKQRGIAGKELIADLLAGNPAVRKYEDLYVPKDQTQNLNPQDLELMRLYRSLEQKKKVKP